MAENKFIKHLKGEQTAGSLLEIKNQNTPASFGNMPQGTSDSNVKYSDVRGDVTVVANGTTAWKLNDSALTLAPIVNGDGTDYISNYAVSGAGLWVNSTYTFPSTGDPNHPVAMIFNPNTKWVLKLCGDNLIVNNGETLELNVIITIGTSNIISKQFTVREQATHFCKELVIDFDESNTSMIKASGLATLQLQVLCGTADASARIYNGMTTLTVLQRKVDAAVVSGTFANVEEVLRDGLLPNDYFSNAAYIAQITDGDTAYAVFQRDGDDVALAGWAQPIPDQTNNAGKFLTTDGSLMSWAQLTISDVDGLSTELSDLQDQIDDLSGRGRFLSVWNCITGLAETNPPTSPYTYQSGDYFIVGTISSATPAVNYRPDGSSYTTGVASTTVETAEVKVDDVYIYDGTNWKLLASSQRTYTFAGIAGSPYDNTNLGNALNVKVDANAAITGDTKCKITYDSKGLVTAGADLAESDIPSLHLSKISDVTASASEVNVLDGITASTTELNYTDGVTSNIQTQIDSKASSSNKVNGVALSTANGRWFGTSDSLAADVAKIVSIPAITSLEAGQMIIVQPTITSTVANSTLQLNSFPAYPMRYNNAAITTSTDSIVWNAACPSIWVFDGTYWVFAGHGLDSNTTYTLNYSVDAGQYTAGSGTYAVTRYSILAQKADGTWEKITATNASYSTGTSKSVNTSGFILNQLRYYGTTTAVAGGVKIATNVMYEKSASVDMRYSTNCGGTTTWALGDYIYLVGTIGADGLFYLDTTTWWSNALPTTNDGKLYIRLGLSLTAAGYTMSFFDDRPIFYHDGTGIKEYKVADNKQDVISDLATIRSGAAAGATAVQPSDLATVATTGDYTDLLNKPTIPAAQVNSDWNAVSGVAEILNKPTLAAVATSGLYSDLTGTPTIPTVNDATLTIQKNGTDVATFTANASSNVTANISVPTTAGDVGAVAANASITGATKCKITYDSKGLVTAGADLSAGDIPDLSATYQPLLTAGTNITISSNTISATDTTYTGSDGITLTGTNFTNSGVRSVSTGSTNGTISVNTNGTSADVSVYGLGSAAYTASTSYATSAQGGKADTAVQPGDLATVATTGDYDDLLNKPTIPTVNDATLTIQKNGTSVATFTANASSNVTANISVPTTTNDLTNNSGFITSSDIPVTDVTVGGTSVVTSGVAAVPAIPTVNDATITITQGGVTKGSFTLNQASGDTIALDAGGGGTSIDAGFVMSFAGSTVPAGWLVCDGSAISRTNYADLFAAIGTTYGSGDGSTTFNLPNIHIPTGATATVLTDGVKKTYLNTGWTDNIPKYANTYYDNNLYLVVSNQTVAVGNQNTNLIADLANSGTLITCIKY